MSKAQRGFGLLPVLLIVVLAGAIAGVGWYVWDKNKDKKPAITNFEECAAAGNPIMESYPEQCVANGQTFTRELSDDEKKALIPPEESSDLVVNLGDYENWIMLVTVKDVNKLDERFPDSFKDYMRAELSGNTKADEYGCLKRYAIELISAVNIRGGAGGVAATDESNDICSAGGAAAYWFLMDGKWNMWGMQDSPTCEALGKTTIYSEFMANCLESYESGTMKPNPNGSIDDADI